MIIDAHAHLFDRMRGRTAAGVTRSARHGWVTVGEERVRLLPPSAGETTFPPEVLLELMDWAGVDRAVLLQGPFYGERNAEVHRAVGRWPDRFIGAAYLDPEADDVREAFRHAVENLGFPIIKLECSVATGLVGLHPELRLDDPRHAWFWEEAERRDRVVTLDLGAVDSRSYQTDAVAAVLARHPRLRVVIAHLAQPPLTAPSDDGRWRSWEDQVSLARHPNVWLDLAALPAYAGEEEYPYPSALAAIRRAVELVGSDRLLWGTDVPGLLSRATYTQLLNLVARQATFLDDVARAAVLGGNAARVYKAND